MKDKQDYGQATGKPDDGGRLEYRAPELIEFGNLAARTFATGNVGMSDGVGLLKTM